MLSVVNSSTPCAPLLFMLPHELRGSVPKKSTSNRTFPSPGASTIPLCICRGRKRHPLRVPPRAGCRFWWERPKPTVCPGQVCRARVSAAGRIPCTARPRPRCALSPPGRDSRGSHDAPGGGTRTQRPRATSKSPKVDASGTRRQACKAISHDKPRAQASGYLTRPAPSSLPPTA
jgi:hypothetical protein